MLDFIPGCRAIQRAIVWLQLLGLSLEYWVSSAIMAIMVEAGKPLSIDDFIDLWRKMGYARVRVEIDAGKPIYPGVLIWGKKGELWQQFVYENLPPVCYLCGRLGHTEDCYQFSVGGLHSASDDTTSPPVISVPGLGASTVEDPAPMMAEGKEREGGGQPKLGSWLVTSQIQQP